MKCNKVISIIRVAVSVVFMASGLAKAFDADHFGSIMASYGVDWFYGLAPLVILAELLFGLALMFDVYTKYTAFAAGVLILVFTTVYTYGVVVADVKDCGCFGRMSVVGTSPAAVYLRNAVLFCGLMLLYFKNHSSANSLSAPVVGASLCLIFASAFMCGHTLKMKTWHTTSADTFTPVVLSQHPLHGMVTTSADSTYMVTVFSYTCPHCMNSIGNMEQYERFGVVDRVIGIAVDNPAAEAEFREVFRPSFRVINIPMEIVAEATSEFPVSYFIRQDSVVGVMTGEVPSAYFFRLKRI